MDYYKLLRFTSFLNTNGLQDSCAEMIHLDNNVEVHVSFIQLRRLTDSSKLKSTMSL